MNHPDSYQHPSHRLKNIDRLPSLSMTRMLLTRKIRIAPTMEQAQVLWALSEKCRLLYNFALAERHNQWTTNRTKPKTERTYITYIQQQNALPTFKLQYPEYTWVYSKVLQMTLRRLDADYKSFFSRWIRGDSQADFLASRARTTLPPCVITNPGSSWMLTTSGFASPTVIRRELNSSLRCLSCRL